LSGCDTAQRLASDAPNDVDAAFQCDPQGNRPDALKQHAARAAHRAADCADDHRLNDALAPRLAVNEVIGDCCYRARRSAECGPKQNHTDWA
jgi:hypothetical protein